MKISNTKNDGFHVRDAFEAAQEQPGPWKPDLASLEVTKSNSSSNDSCWSRFMPALECNPMLKIDAYPPCEVIKPSLETDCVIAPKSCSMIMEHYPDGDFTLQFQFMPEEKRIDAMKHFFVVQVTDDQTDTTGDKDRCIAECLLTLKGFNTEQNQTNWCKIPVFERVEGSLCGHLLLKGSIHDQIDKNGIKTIVLTLELVEIINLKDPNLALVKEESTFKRDAIFMLSWCVYIIFTVVFYILQEDFSFIDALYLRVVTLFTVGYGDLFPVTNSGKIFNCIFIILDTVTLSFVISKVAQIVLRLKELRHEKRQNEEKLAKKRLKQTNDTKNKQRTMSQEAVNKLADGVGGHNEERKEEISPDIGKITADHNHFDVYFEEKFFSWDPLQEVAAGSDDDTEKQWMVYWKELRRSIRSHFGITSFVLKYGKTESSDLVLSNGRDLQQIWDRLQADSSNNTETIWVKGRSDHSRYVLLFRQTCTTPIQGNLTGDIVFELSQSNFHGWVLSMFVEKEEHGNCDLTRESMRESASQFWAKNKLKVYSILMGAMVLVGTLFMIYAEGYDAPSAFEWNFVTLSTVGYGNIVPNTVGGKVFVIFYISFGVPLVITFAAAIVELVRERKLDKFKEGVMRRALISEAQLYEFDIDGDGEIDKYEFLSKMLVETQEVDEAKIKEIMAKFELLDEDGSGEITVEELRAIDENRKSPSHASAGASGFQHFSPTI